MPHPTRVALLQANARESTAHLARKLGIARTTVVARLAAWAAKIQAHAGHGSHAADAPLIAGGSGCVRFPAPTVPASAAPAIASA